MFSSFLSRGGDGVAWSFVGTVHEEEAVAQAPLGDVLHPGAQPLHLLGDTDTAAVEEDAPPGLAAGAEDEVPEAVLDVVAHVADLPDPRRDRLAAVLALLPSS